MKYLYRILLPVFVLATLMFIQPAQAQIATWPSLTKVTNLSNGFYAWLCNGAFTTLPYQTRDNVGITDDGNGGFIVVWGGYYYGSSGYPPYYTIFAQRVSSTGQVLWTSSPVANGGVSVGQPASGHYSYWYGPASCVSDGNGGGYIAWVEY